MTGARQICLIDTNVLVYAVDLRDEIKRMRAISILERTHRLNMGVLSPQILGEFFTAVTRRLPSPLSAADAGRLVADYVASWEVHDLTGAVVVDAVRGLIRYQLSYWDALIWATARDRGCHYLLSEDFNNGATIEGVRFVNPFAADFQLEGLR
jgi:predicted nucleic acid-binding protein